jgi:capsular polysaccharide biosynthesis protein
MTILAGTGDGPTQAHSNDDRAATCPPAPTFFRWGKYLVPATALRPRTATTPAPSHFLSIHELAEQSPQSTSLTHFHAAGATAAGCYPVYSAGKQLAAQLPPETHEGDWVARIRGGRLYGRHATALSPGGSAVIRESGFFLAPESLRSKGWLGRYGLRHRRYLHQIDLTSRRNLPGVCRVPGTAAALNLRSSHNFYHWLIDILPRLATLRRAGIEADRYLIDCLSPRQQEVLTALGIASSQLVQPHCELLLEPDEVILPSWPGPDAIRDLGQRLASGLAESANLPAPDAPDRLYISRRLARTRRVRNEAQLTSLLIQRGFRDHAMEEHSLAHQCQLVRGAREIVAVHGAGLANLLFARPGTVVVEIVPEGRYNADLYPRLSRMLGLDHRVVVARSARTRQLLRVELGDVERALDVRPGGSEPGVQTATEWAA